jgi:hypothetical protein
MLLRVPPVYEPQPQETSCSGLDIQGDADPVPRPRQAGEYDAPKTWRITTLYRECVDLVARHGNAAALDPSTIFPT